MQVRRETAAVEVPTRIPSQGYRPPCISSRDMMGRCRRSMVTSLSSWSGKSQWERNGSWASICGADLTYMNQSYDRRDAM